MERPVLIVDCSCLREPDLATIDLLARLHIASRRQGVDMRLQHASTALCVLIDFAGLGGLLGLEPLGESEEREELRGVEEEGELRDPAP